MLKKIIKLKFESFKTKTNYEKIFKKSHMQQKDVTK